MSALGCVFDLVFGLAVLAFVLLAAA